MLISVDETANTYAKSGSRSDRIITRSLETIWLDPKERTDAPYAAFSYR